MKIVESVQSSNISGIKYDEVNQDLFITYKSGVTYKYKSVPDKVFEDFKSAESKGSFANKFIKSQFKYERI